MWIVQSVLPCLKILRLTDRNKAGMDQLYFHVWCTDEKIKHAAASINKGDLWGFKESTALEVLSEDKFSGQGEDIYGGNDGDSDDDVNEDDEENDNDDKINDDDKSNDESNDDESDATDK
jgi:hypothetical protein